MLNIEGWPLDWEYAKRLEALEERVRKEREANLAGKQKITLASVKWLEKP